MDGRSALGWFLIFAGMFYLSLPTFVNLPLSTVSLDTPIGSLKVIDISEFSATNIFIGFGLIVLGIFVIMKQRGHI